MEMGTHMQLFASLKITFCFLCIQLNILHIYRKVSLSSGSKYKLPVELLKILPLQVRGPKRQTSRANVEAALLVHPLSLYHALFGLTWIHSVLSETPTLFIAHPEYPSSFLTGANQRYPWSSGRSYKGPGWQSIGHGFT